MPDGTFKPKQCRFFFCELERVFRGSERFLLKIFRYSDCYADIILINVPLVKKLAIKDKYLSKFITKHYGCLENFYIALSDPNDHIFDILKHNEIAIGIVLGFGTENSKFFQRFVDLGFHLKKYPFVCLLPFEPKPMLGALTPNHASENVPYKPFIPKQNSKFPSLDAELEEMEKMRDRAPKGAEIPYLFQVPFFISKKGKKAEKLRMKYQRARGKLSRLFANKKFKPTVTEFVAESANSSV